MVMEMVIGMAPSSDRIAAHARARLMPGPVGTGPVAADPRGPESAYAASAIAGSRGAVPPSAPRTDRWTHRRPCLRSFRSPIVVTRGSRTRDG